MNKENKLLQNQIRYACYASPFYRALVKEQDLDISTAIDLGSLPLTNKDQLAKDNEAFLAVNKDEVADYVTTSGTLGEAVSFYLTQKDLDRLATNEAEAMKIAGASATDVFQLMVTMDKLFMAGLAYYLGARKLGAGVVRQGAASPEAQLKNILRFQSTVLVAIPSFIVALIAYAKDQDIDLNATSVQRIICIGEPIRSADLSLNTLGKKIKESWDVALHSTYASTEMATAFTECSAGKGGHLIPGLLTLEVINEVGDPVESGAMGEVVVTPLGVEGMPLLRYQTGDLCKVYYEPCSCGRNTPRLGPVLGRKQQMIKYKGTTIFPAALHDILARQEIQLYQIEITKSELDTDQVAIYLANAMLHQKESLESAFRAQIRVVPALRFIDEATLRNRVFKAEKRKQEKIIVR